MSKAPSLQLWQLPNMPLAIVGKDRAVALTQSQPPKQKTQKRWVKGSALLRPAVPNKCKSAPPQGHAPTVHGWPVPLCTPSTTSTRCIRKTKRGQGQEVYHARSGARRREEVTSNCKGKYLIGHPESDSSREAKMMSQAYNRRRARNQLPLR